MQVDSFASVCGLPAPRGLEISTSFSHPLLRLAAKLDASSPGYTAFRRSLCRALDATAPLPERVEAGQNTLLQVAAARLDRYNLALFRFEFLRYICSEIPWPPMLLQLVEVELEERGAGIEPHLWVTGRVHEAPESGLGLPRIVANESTQSLHHGLAARRMPFLPDEALQACEAAIGLAVRASANGSLSMWSLRECEAAASLLVLAVVLGDAGSSSKWGPRSDQPIGQLDVFEGVGLALWEELAKQALGADGAVKHSPLWEPALRQRVLLHLRGRVLADSTRVEARAADSVINPTVECDPGWIRVIPGEIPPCTWKEDNQALKSYERLQQPLPVARMPDQEKLQVILASLDQEFPWATSVLHELRSSLSTASLLGVPELTLPPVLLVGPPGGGKSRLVRRLGELLELPFLPLAVGGSSDAKLLLGTARGWGSAQASPLLRLLLQHESASALVLLDEVDKVGENSSQAPPISCTLLSLLEPETARRWHDSFLQTACDLSRVGFWGTANSLTGMSRALLSRFAIAYMPAPSRDHLPVLVHGICRDFERQWRLPEGVLPNPPPSLMRSAGGSVRELKRSVLEWLHAWAQQHRQSRQLH